MKKQTLILCLLLTILCAACAPVKCSLYCEHQEYTISVDNQELGNGLISFQAPNGTTYVHVQILNEGEVIYETDVYVKDYHNNQLVTISVPENYKYSSSYKFHN